MLKRFRIETEVCNKQLSFDLLMKTINQLVPERCQLVTNFIESQQSIFHIGINNTVTKYLNLSNTTCLEPFDYNTY